MNSKTTSRTDWDRIDRMTDDEIDLSDSPELDEEFFKNAQLRLPSDHSVLLRVDEDNLRMVRKTGAGFSVQNERGPKDLRRCPPLVIL